MKRGKALRRSWYTLRLQPKTASDTSTRYLAGLELATHLELERCDEHVQVWRGVGLGKKQGINCDLMPRSDRNKNTTFQYHTRFRYHTCTLCVADKVLLSSTIPALLHLRIIYLRCDSSVTLMNS